MTTDPLFESLQRLQPMLDSFSNSLSHLCEANDNFRDGFALRKDLEDYYQHLYKDILSRYETLKQKEKEIHDSAAQPEVDREIKQENSSAIAGYSPPQILPVKICPELESLCCETDGDGLRNLIILRKNKRAQAKLRVELPAALSKSPESGKLVLEAIRGYDLSGSSSASNKKKEVAKCKRAFILLLECLFPVLGRDESTVVPKDIKDKAREIAQNWRRKMGLDKDVDSADELDIRAFLQLLTTFRIAKDYAQDELCELLVPIARYREGPALCLFLGLYNKIPDFLDKLSKTGKWIDCIRYAHAFGLMDKIKPADLFKAYLEDVKKAARDILKKGNGSVESLKYSTRLERCAFNKVIKIVKEYDLQNVYSIDDLQKEAQRLEQDEAANRSLATKRKAEDEKKAANATKEENKVATSEAGKKRKAADATKEENEAAAAKAGKQKKTADIREDEKNAEVEKTKQKRLQSSEPADSIIGFFGIQAPGERGLYRPSEKAKPVSKDDFNGFAGGKRNSPSGIELLSRYQSSYHDAIRNTMGSSSDMTLNNEQKSYDSNPSTSRYSNINPIGVSLYGSSSMIGAFGVSAFNQSQINHDVRALQSCMPSATSSAYAVSSLNPAQVHSEHRTLQSYTSAFGAFASPRHGKCSLTSSSSSLVQNTLAFGGGNLSNTGSSVHGYGDSLEYNSYDSPVPSYITQINLERREPEQQKPSFANINRLENGRAASVGYQSAISKYQFNGGL